MQVVRLDDALPAWERAARNGDLGLEHARVAARAFARTAVRDAFIDEAGRLPDDAIDQPTAPNHSRLFTGAAREAVMLTHDTCIWFGCDAPVRRTADHHIEWMRHHGRTDPDSGGPLCGRHNRLEARHHDRITRRPDGGDDITHLDRTPPG